MQRQPGTQRGRRRAIHTKGISLPSKRRSTHLGPEPAAPLLPLFTCQEPTFEGLCRALEHGQPSIGIFATEGGQFIAGHAMSAENKLKTAAGLSCAWDGERINRVRAGDGVTILMGRRVSMHLMVQPGVAAIMLSDPELADQGMLSRCLVIAPDSYSGRRFYCEPVPETKNKLMEYERRLHDILKRKFPLAASTRNVLAPRVFGSAPVPRMSGAPSRTMWKGKSAPVGRSNRSSGSPTKRPNTPPGLPPC